MKIKRVIVSVIVMSILMFTTAAIINSKNVLATKMELKNSNLSSSSKVSNASNISNGTNMSKITR